MTLGEEKLDAALPGDAKECFNVGPDLAADDPLVLAGKPYHAVNQWPALPGFRATILAFQAAALELVVLLQRAIAVDLGLDERFFDEHFSAAVGVLRLLHYPPHPGTFDGSLYGAGAHTDYGSLTLLAQDETGGLEVRRRDGTWVPVTPQPGTFVCNIGDCFMRWTNDIYVSNAWPATWVLGALLVGIGLDFRTGLLAVLAERRCDDAVLDASRCDRGCGAERHGSE